jgi:hypothetical protein
MREREQPHQALCSPVTAFVRSSCEEPAPELDNAEQVEWTSKLHVPDY